MTISGLNVKVFKDIHHENRLITIRICRGFEQVTGLKGPSKKYRLLKVHSPKKPKKP